MKKFLSIFLAAVTLASCLGIAALAYDARNKEYNSFDSYLAKDHLTYYVMTGEENQWKYTNEDDEEDNDYNFINYAYNSKGYLTKEYRFIGEYSHTNYFTYDSKYNITKITTKSEADDSDGTSSTSYFYDSNSNITKIKDGDFVTTCYYDKKGRITKAFTTDNNDYSEKDLYTYDKNGRISKKSHETIDADEYYFSETNTYSYDSSGNLVKAIAKNSYGKVEKNTYAYDNEGRLTKETYKNSFDVAEAYTYKYDSDGNLVKKTVKNDDGSMTYSYYYDSKGNLVEERIKDSSGILLTTTFNYNSKGLLTKKTNLGSYTETYTYDKNGNNTKINRKYVNGDTTTSTYTYKKLSSPICVINDKIRLSNYEFTYNGKKKEPLVFIKSLTKGIDYSVQYSNNVNPGKATVRIDFTDPRKAPITITFFIRPAKVSGLKVASTAKTSATLTWTKTPKASKYAVYKYIDKTQKYVKLGVFKTNKATIKSLKSKTVYKFCVKAIGGGIYSSSYSAKVKATTK